MQKDNKKGREFPTFPNSARHQCQYIRGQRRSRISAADVGGRIAHFKGRGIYRR